MHFILHSAGMSILASFTLLLSLTNAYMEVTRLETRASRHRNITIDCMSKCYLLISPAAVHDALEDLSTDTPTVTFFDQVDNGSTTCNSTFLPSTSTQTYYPGPPFSIACTNPRFRWYFNTFDNSSSFSLYLQHSYDDKA